MRAVFLIPLLLAGSLAQASPAERAATGAGATESVEEALCRLIQGSARDSRVPAGYLTRLIWRESGFRTGVTSRAGAQGVAQFMPGTAAERGLLNPFDPEEAIPAAARFLAELRGRFGNWGLAAAAYNGGPARLANWLANGGQLPAETRAYVAAITARTVEDWAADARAAGTTEPSVEDEPVSCLKLAATLRRPGRSAEFAAAPLAESPFAPWGVQLAGNFSKERALAAYARARQSFAAVVGETRPMVIGTRLRSRGTRAFYRVRLPAPTREAADTLCGRIRSAGGSCVALPS